MFCFDFQPFVGDLFVTGRRHFLLSELSLSFNSVMISLTSARPSARTVELASGARPHCQSSTIYLSLSCASLATCCHITFSVDLHGLYVNFL